MSTSLRAHTATCLDCGWTTKATRTPGYAREALRRHSCDHHRRLAAQHQRGRARFNPDRTPKPCNHPRARHRHGTRDAYVCDGCRCIPCAYASAEYSAGYHRRKAQQAPVPARCEDPTGTVRRVRALAAMGWSLRAVARHTGLSDPTIADLAHDRSRPTATTKRLIAACYRDLATHEPPQRDPRERGYVQVIRARAAREGWVGPAAWGDDIDRPDARPEPSTSTTRRASSSRTRTEIEESVIDAALSGRDVPLSHAERRVLVAELHGKSLTDAQIADRLHLNERTVLRIRQRLGLASNYDPSVTNQGLRRRTA